MLDINKGADEMATPQEQRRIRLKNDYKTMQNIKGAMVQWRPLVGEPPYVEKYELTVNVRTIISSRPEYRDRHVIYVTLPSGYPHNSAPQIVMQTNPQPFHPNWFGDKRWCYGSWDVSEGLGHHVIRMIRTLQFDPDITNENSAANGEANRWYLANLNRGLFPCDRQTLPDPTGKIFRMHSQARKRFDIQ